MLFRSGDFLQGFFLGTRSALAENSRESMTITVTEVNSNTVGMLIALFERSVGFYASLVNINAYHQPGVEAGKKAAGNVLTIQRQIIAFLKSNINQNYSATEIAKHIGKEEEIETVFKICEHLSANKSRKIKKKKSANVFAGRYKSI